MKNRKKEESKRETKFNVRVPRGIFLKLKHFWTDGSDLYAATVVRQFAVL